MTDAASLAVFLSHLQQHWPFPIPLAGCTLVSTRFTAQALSPELFSHYGIAPPQAALKRQAEFLAARLCAREALRQQTGHASLPTQQDNSRAPRWPTHSCGSMSHSHNLSAAIVGDSRYWQGLGLDIEKPIPIQRAQRLAKTILTPDEQYTYNRLDSNQQAMYLTLVFSFKESLFKALNPLTGTYFGFHDAQVLDLENSAMGHARLRLSKDLSTQWRLGCELQGQFSRLHGSALTLVSVAVA
ncbi:MAG: 4'-phosphopantetheinyl transferase superfamily protein [Pseudomonas sp.]|jgi:enterobactin synthetase component D|nr:4'-phosphopantetheinyl transferase superfamily protein [Pseudomonas sp.]MDD2223981.1 4'-phosphopantetheinyl transferase superfamily protein [Pseudomonas sp.]MDY0413999.1 4'-phosphopantetheinyl transferase superfamily protein [Pseudomonas sp.]NLO54801.1 4'-phosphopantetheinyl transferase superfamily protein [Gammaproteobacteria bacterium]